MKSDFLVVGAGAVGLACALELLNRGANVTLVERSLCGGEASWAGGGILSPLCPWDYPDEVTSLALRGASLFPDWSKSLSASTGIDTEYSRSGMLVLPPFDSELAHEWCTAHDVRIETVSAAAVSGDQALLLPDVSQVRNPRLLQALRSRVETLGGRIVERCEVLEIVATQDRVSELRTSCGALSADEYIVAAGAWSKKMLGQYALDLDIRPIRGQMLLFKFDAPPIDHIVLQKDLYLIPRRDGHLLVGSTLEDVGFDKSTTETALDNLQSRAQLLLPQLLGMPVVLHWAGLRPASPRNIPTIGRHPHLGNLYLNSGHFRYGVTMAPASAEIMLNDLSGLPQYLDVAPYRNGWGAG